MTKNLRLRIYIRFLRLALRFWDWALDRCVLLNQTHHEAGREALDNWKAINQELKRAKSELRTLENK